MTPLPSVLVLKGCNVDIARRVARRGDERVRLTAVEASLLGHLSSRPGAVVPRDALLVEVWGYQPGVVSRAVDTAMGRLRAKLEVDAGQPDHLFTERGRGYRFEPLAGADARADAAPTPSPRAPQNSGLPRPATDLIGRTDEFAALRERLADRRLVTLRGPGGAGKTRLAVECGREWPGTVLFVDLTSAGSVEEAVRLVAASLELGAIKSPQAAVGRALRGRETDLLILDNCEQVGGLGEPAAEWLGASEVLRILATSRTPLGSSAESVVVVGAMGREDAATLFIERAAATGRSAPVPRDEELYGLIEDLDGLPLAIELAAGRSAILSPKQLRERLRQRFRLLAGGKSPVDRHRALSATLEWSWELLGEGERAALMDLAVFVRPFTLAAAAAVLDVEDDLDALDLVEALVEASLVRTEQGPGGEPRFALFVSVREFAADKQGAEARAAAERRHAEYWVDEGEAFRERWQLTRNDGQIKGMRLVVEELLAAYRRPSLRSTADLTLRAGLLAARVLRGDGAGELWISLSLDCAARLTESDDPHLRVTSAILDAHRELSNLERARGHTERALRLAEEADRDDLRSLAWHGDSWVAVVHYDLARAVRSAQLSEEAAVAAEHPVLIRRALRVRVFAETASKSAGAHALCDRLRDVGAREGCGYDVAEAARSRSALLSHEGRAQAAMSAAEEAVAHLRGGVRFSLGGALNSLAVACRTAGELERARAVGLEARAEFEWLGAVSALSVVDLNLVSVEIGLGRLDDAGHRLLDGPTSAGAGVRRFYVPMLEAHLSLARGDVTAAIEHLRIACDGAVGLALPDRRARLAATLGLLVLVVGDRAEARHRTVEAAGIAADEPDEWWADVSRCALAAVERVSPQTPPADFGGHGPGARLAVRLVRALAGLAGGGLRPSDEALTTLLGDGPGHAQIELLPLAAWHALRAELDRADQP